MNVKNIPVATRSGNFPALAPSIDKIRILSIDDESKFTDQIKNDLEATGDFEVITSQSPSIALARVEKLMPDFVVVDICMPHMDGGDFLHALKSKPSFQNVPTLMLSSLVSPSEMDAKGFVMSAGTPVMAKPFSSNSLIAHILGRLNGTIRI